MFFVSFDGFDAVKLWQSDGTEAGTTWVRDFVPDGVIVGDSLTVVGDQLYFFVSNKVDGYQLWKSNGSEAGTVLVKNLLSNPTSSHVRAPDRGTVIGDLLLFSAEDGVHGTELWVSDGTESGTFMVKDLKSGANSSFPGEFTRVGDVVYFMTQYDLWVSDGTETGTVFVEKLPNRSPRMFAWGEQLYIAVADEIWKSDGPTLTVFISGICDSNYTSTYTRNYIRVPTVINNKLYLICEDNHHDTFSPMYEINQNGQTIGSIGMCQPHMDS